MSSKMMSSPSQTMTSREIADLTVKQHAHVCRDIRSMLIEVHGADRLNKIVPEQYRNRHSEYIREHAQEVVSALFGDDPKRDHVDSRGFSWARDTRGYISEYQLDKDHTFTLLTGYDATARMKIIKRWQELERAQVAPVFNIPTTLSGALQLAADQARQIEAQIVQIAELEPKAQFHDRVTQSHDLLTIREAAKLLRTGERRLFGFLRREGLLMKSNQPMQTYMDRDLFRLVETPWKDQFGRVRISVKTCMTQKGLVYVQGLQDQLAMYEDILD